MSDKELADWIVATCLLYGTTVATAYQVAGLFVKGVRKGLSPSKAQPKFREESDG